MDPLLLLDKTDRWQWPDGARDIVLAGLGDAEASRRRLAAELASTTMDDTLAMHLLALACNDPDEDVRTAATGAFGPALEECELGDWEDAFDEPPIGRSCFAEIQRVLERIYRDAESPKAARRRALETAVRAPEPWQRGAARAAWRSDDEEWRATAVRCMGHLGGFDDELVEALEVRTFLLDAVTAIGLCGCEIAGEQILSLARSCWARDIRLAAVEALGNLHPPGSHELLVELSVSEDEPLCALASEALAVRGEGLRADFDAFFERDAD
jgi:HEAT repeat protein